VPGHLVVDEGESELVRMVYGWLVEEKELVASARAKRRQRCNPLESLPNFFLGSIRTRQSRGSTAAYLS
jgi:hypothetical protein